MREVREAVEYYACSRLQTSYKFRYVRLSLLDGISISY
jgi:hypothetical protein